MLLIANSEIINNQLNVWNDLWKVRADCAQNNLPWQWYINLQAPFQWTNCPSYPIRWRKGWKQTAWGWFTFVLLWHMLYTQDTQRSSVERLISTTINARTLHTTWCKNSHVTSCLLYNTCPQGQPHPASILKAVLWSKHNIIPAHPPSISSSSCPRAICGGRFREMLHSFETTVLFSIWCQFCLCQRSCAFSAGHERLDKNV